MPGVLHSNIHCGFSREIGKMAFLGHSDLMTLTDNDYGDIPDSLFQASRFFLDSADSDCDLPDNEHPVDLITFLDSPDIDLENHFNQGSCGDRCNTCSTKYSRCVSTRQDPFMGLRSTEHSEVRAGTSASSSPVEQQDCPVYFEDSGSEEIVQEQYQDLQDRKPFIAWNTPKSEDDNDYIAAKNSLSWLAPLEEDTSDLTFPDTPSPSAPSGTNTGDDSDVDIETITDAPRSADSCGYITQDSSPEISPPVSPELYRKFHNGVSNKSGNSPNMFKITSSTSLSLNMANHSNYLGQKRKLSKDRKSTCKPHSQTVYHHVLCNSNSVNFHDYAMSPGACHYSSSTETGRPTVLSKRLYKRHVTVDHPGKEKQHHHNQLERNRRQKLADLFVDLRDEVPKIANQAKASKVLILREATSYIHELKKWDKQQEDDISRERRRKESLKNKLRHLQSQLLRQCVK